MLRIFVTAFALTVLLGVMPAKADTQAYCELYAKDFADGRTSVVDQWQLAYRGAFDDCMMQYAATPDTAAPVVSEQPEEAAPEPVAEPAPKQKAKPKVTKVAERKSKSTSAAKAASKKLVPGTDEWNDYCDRKYNSFNRQSGTYMSRSGKIRRCK
jgi:BA14K-like protein